MSDHDDDWDVTLLSEIVEMVVWNDVDGFNWSTITLIVVGIALAIYHYWG